MLTRIMLVLALAAPAAQAQDVAAPMQPFEFLVGQWEGPAWYMRPDGQRVDVIQTEDVYTAAGGHVIVVQGAGFPRQADGTGGEAAFNAFGVLSYDPATGTHYVDAFNDGRHIRTEARLTDDGFEWGFEAGGRTVNYVMRLDDEGRWVETGSMLIGPDRWVPFVEMTLGRVGE
jgi:hypothetical protein